MIIAAINQISGISTWTIDFFHIKFAYPLKIMCDFFKLMRDDKQNYN